MPLSKQWINVMGLVAGAMTTVSFLPQLVAVYRSKSAKDLSYGYLVTFAAGVMLWLIYGIFLMAPPIILTNVVTFALVVVIVILKIRYHA